MKESKALIKLDLEICDLYFKAIGKILSEEDSENDINNMKCFLNLISPSANSKSRKRQISKKSIQILKQTLFYRISYIYWNSTCFSSSVARHFRKFLVEHSNVLKELLSKKKIRICSLGGGCVSDVIAIVKVLESFAEVNQEMDICVSVIDMDGRWRNTSLSILQSLERFRNLTWKIDFIQADLTKPLNDSVESILKNADIVSAVKFLSESENVKSRWNIFPKMRNLTKPGSLLFFLDYSTPSVVDAFGNKSGDIPGYCLLYEAAYDLHTLDRAVVERLFLLYGDQFHLSKFCTDIIVLTRVWQRPCSDPGSDLKEQLSKRKARLQKEIEEIRLLQIFRFESIQFWEFSFINERKKKWRNKKKIQKIIKPDGGVVEAELGRKMNLVASIKEKIKIEEKELENSYKTYLLTNKEIENSCKTYLSTNKELENCKAYISKNKVDRVASSRKATESKQKNYKKNVRKLVKRLNQKYPIYLKNVEKDGFDSQFNLSEINLDTEALFVYR
ncbi:uncharacterized protein NPIL_538101 [Nephila pilipes]|uniref:Uncharacterized protein n=1 Tax=Nephila pilipes TaxID=299642 RepID=A0A8X6TSU3_NEPPI|nr:uncharacterized protein NPIL_538101 [Nephila pilipes]